VLIGSDLADVFGSGLAGQQRPGARPIDGLALQAGNA
jgi:hypothetical protein